MRSAPVLLIAGGGHADIPLIHAAQKLGYYVVTTGNRPEELGHRHSNEYRRADYSSRDAMLALARDIGASAVCACCNDFSAISCAYVAEQLGLPGHDPVETAELIHHKDRFREFSLQHGMPVPDAIGVSDVDAGVDAVHRLGLPVIIKPVDLTGGKGVSTVREAAEARPALERAFGISRAGRMVVEQFISGSRHGFSAFVVDGKVVFHFSDNEHYYLNPYLVAAASVPSTAPREVDRELCALSERYTSLLRLKTGIFHVQYILHEGRPVIIEICRRAPGDLYIRLVQLATGVDYPSWIVRASAGLPCQGLSQAEPRGCYVRHCIMAPRGGTVRDIVFDSSLEGHVVDSMMWWKRGDEVVDPMTAKFGIVFLRFDSQAEMLEKEARMAELIRVVME